MKDENGDAVCKVVKRNVELSIADVRSVDWEVLKKPKVEGGAEWE